jgi:hypothetical protein
MSLPQLKRIADRGISLTVIHGCGKRRTVLKSKRDGLGLMTESHVQSAGVGNEWYELGLRMDTVG